MGDDGVGLRLLEELMGLDLADGVEYVDGGTIGLSLLPLVQDATSLLVLDAVAPGGTGAGRREPGDVVRLDGDQLPRLLRTQLSPHQVGLLDVLVGARLLRADPERMCVVGVVPSFVDLAWGLTPVVEAAVPEALRVAREVLEGWWER
ncbi:hydrogenase maturation protease [Nocardioides sp. GY 10127]|nr:hydrogenase maturation protease [Nocardioides sp. GY 10127]